MLPAKKDETATFVHPHLEAWVEMNSQKESEKLEKQLASVRARKISKLKQKIAAGKYHVDNMALARALFLAQ